MRHRFGRVYSQGFQRFGSALQSNFAGFYNGGFKGVALLGSEDGHCN
jgi:hypothetical protein